MTTAQHFSAGPSQPLTGYTEPTDPNNMPSPPVVLFREDITNTTTFLNQNYGDNDDNDEFPDLADVTDSEDEDDEDAAGYPAQMSNHEVLVYY